MSFKKIAFVEDTHTEDHPHDGGVTQKLIAENTHESAAANTHHQESHDLSTHSNILHSQLTLTGTDEHHTQIHNHHLTTYISFGDLQGSAFNLEPTP